MLHCFILELLVFGKPFFAAIVDLVDELARHEQVFVLFLKHCEEQIDLGVVFGEVLDQFLIFVVFGDLAHAIRNVFCVFSHPCRLVLNDLRKEELHDEYKVHDGEGDQIHGRVG